jgi:DNA-binding Lrp family transcriptional regulator
MVSACILAELMPISLKRRQNQLLRLNVLVQLKAHEVRSAYESISEIKGVRRASRVAGAYDVIAYAELESVKELKGFMDRLRLMPGFIHADTCVAL